MSAKRWIAALVIVGVAGAVSWTLANPGRAESANDTASGAIPTERVMRGTLALDVHLDGDLRAARTVSIPAPSVGGTLRILSMLDTGAEVSAGDEVMTFDPAEQQFALEQALSELAEAEQEIRKQEADVAVQLAQDQVALLTAQFDVKRAELDVNIDPDLMAANDIKKRQLSLEEAKRRLEQVERDVKSKQTTSTSGLAVRRERRSKSQLNADRARQNIDSLVLTAPIDGVVLVRENRDASGGVFFSGMSLPEWRTGDSAFAGRPMFDVFDPGEMEIRAMVNEQERANLAPGQSAMVELKASAGTPRPATVLTVGNLGRTTQGPFRMFEVMLKLDAADPAFRPGTTVNIVVTGRQIEDVLTLPKHAVFEKDGKSQVYVRVGDTFEMRAITVLHRSESRLAVEGIDEGAEVALVDPTARPGAAAAATTPAPGGGS